jgi:hypothetical protein
MNTIVLKIESGVVSEVYASAPTKVIVVDHDVIEGGETFEERVAKSVSTMDPDKRFNPNDREALIISLVLDCVRPADRGPLLAVKNRPDAAA